MIETYSDSLFTTGLGAGVGAGVGRGVGVGVGGATLEMGKGGGGVILNTGEELEGATFFTSTGVGLMGIKGGATGTTGVGAITST